MASTSTLEIEGQMLELHNILQDNATPAPAPVFSTLEMPAVEAVFARTGNLRAIAGRSPPFLRAVLATLASVTAIAVLVFLCSRGYKGRAGQYIGGRRLASSEDSPRSFDICFSSGDEDEQEEQQTFHVPISPVSEDWKLPLKKRLFARVAGFGAGSEACNSQQREQQQHQYEPYGTPLGIHPTQMAPLPGQLGFLPLPISSPLYSTPVQTPAHLDPSSRLFYFYPYQQAAGPFALPTWQAFPQQVEHLQPEVFGPLPEQQIFQRDCQQLQLHLQQQQVLLKQQEEQQAYHWELLAWQQLWQRQALLQQQAQQQYLLQQQQQLHYLLQEHHERQHMLQRQHQYLLQQHEQLRTMQPPEQQQAIQNQEVYQKMQQYNWQVTPKESTQEQEKRQRKRKCQEELESLYKKQQLRQSAHPLSGYLPEEWIDPDSPMPETPQASLRPETPQASPRPETPQDSPRPETSQDSPWPEAPPDSTRPETPLDSPGPETPQDSPRPETPQDSPRPETPQASTSHQASKFAAAAAADRSTLGQFSMQVIPGFPLVPSPASPAAAPEAFRREAAAVLAAGDAAASAVAIKGGLAGGPSSAESTTAGEGGNLSVQTFFASHDEGSGDSETSSTAAEGSALPAPVSAPPIAELSGTRDVSMRGHPFVRLPLRTVKGTTACSLVNLRRAVTTHPGRRDVVPLLQRAHELLSGQALTVGEMRELAHVTGSLIEHAVNHQHRDMSRLKTSRAIVRLGIRFLLLDVVVSSFIVLGQTPDPVLWKAFTDAISHAAPQMNRGRSSRGRQTFAYCLCQELSRQIQILKTGRRPDPAAMVRAKRLLFCSASSPKRFQKKDFDPWREDDRNAAAGP
ncbi:hypothetical protein EPH_0004950 [Eimeria praecox]|uniref:Uncharacterized protein n=1 Tax=Eimeria praecox TaxID=51316 RepID=U6G726_9EIME|nr:hypothetical protein EPH_0004950 [Eimeria praecox]